jgi:hypothetical protein
MDNLLLFNIAHFIGAIDIILLIKELHLAGQLMPNSTDEDIVELVTSVIIFNLMTIMECQYLGALHYQGGRVDPCFSLPTAPSSDLPKVVWTFKDKASDRWSMLSLF